MSQFIAVLDAKELAPGKMTTVRVRGRDLCLVNLGGSFHALDNRCPHLGGQLGDGTLEGSDVICPLHKWDFDVRTGVSRYDPRDSVATYPTRVRDGRVEIDGAAVPPLPESDGYLARWARHEEDLETARDTIDKLARGRFKETEPMRTTRPVPGFDEIYFLPGQLATPPLLDDEEVATEAILGARCEKPIRLSAPFYVSHMSFGALSKEAKIALAEGSARFGTMTCSGEGGMLDEEREAAGAYVFEMASGYFGWSEESIRRADAIEIKIGQSAKSGLGGVLPGSKVTAEIAKVRGLEQGQDAVSPSRFPDIDSPRELRRRLDWIRSVNPGIPVGIKIAAAKLEADLEAACDAGADFITVDGRPGGTGAAPKHIKDHIGVPTLFALPRARRWLDEQGMSDVTLCITGGLRTPADIGKALALGADAVALATAAMMAIGCQQYRACSSDSCPVGIATQRRELRDRFSIEESSARLLRFFEGTRRQLVDYARICGRRSLADLCPDDLATSNDELARYTGIRHLAAPYR